MLGIPFAIVCIQLALTMFRTRGCGLLASFSRAKPIGSSSSPDA
jgi:hypothetical protein